MPHARQTLGREGETRAARFLEARGYRIVARNVRADRVEIDLIARRGPLLVFVEVKTRRARHHGQAAEAVDPRKQRRLRHGAMAWLASDPVEGRGTRRRRFDVVTCLFDGSSGTSEASGASGTTDTSPSPRAAQNDATPPGHEDGAGWSFEHWEAAF